MAAAVELPWLSAFREEQQDSADGHPSKARLETVSEFFQYTEHQDEELFKELDRDGDGRVTVDDLKLLLAKNNLAPEYASQFVNRARGGRWWSSSITFEEFKSQVDDLESKILRAFCQLELDSKGSLDLPKIKVSLKRMGLPASDDNAAAMLRALGAAEDASIAYGEFRRFAVLIPGDKLGRDAEANLTWFESATCMPLGSDVDSRAGTFEVLAKAALAGGLSSGCSTLALHPLDTVKTRVQSIPGATIRSALADSIKLGRAAAYRGVIPATTGAFSCHGIRTCAYEAGLMVLGSLGLPHMQAQPLASLAGTMFGTVVRIPCEVLKQQLQNGNHPNVRVAMTELRRLDGLGGFFRGAGPLMFREVPFYVFGMVLYEQYKRCFNGSHFGSTTRELSTREYIMIGGLAGASASLITTPADVIKSRTMTAAAGTRATTGKIIVDIIQKEGLLALFKGALPRAVWIAPLGAMNFAGYELAKRAMGVGVSDAASAAAESESTAAAPQPAAAAAAAKSTSSSTAPPSAAPAPPPAPPAEPAAPSAPSSTAPPPVPPASEGGADGATPATPAPAAPAAPSDAGLGATGSITASVTRLVGGSVAPASRQAPPSAPSRTGEASAGIARKRIASGASEAPEAKRPRQLTPAQRNAAAVALVRARAANSAEAAGGSLLRQQHTGPGADSVRRRLHGEPGWAAPMLSVHRVLHQKVHALFGVGMQAR